MFLLPRALPPSLLPRASSSELLSSHPNKLQILRSITPYFSMYLYQLLVFLYECLVILQCWLEFNRLKVLNGTWNDTLAKLGPHKTTGR